MGLGFYRLFPLAANPSDFHRVDLFRCFALLVVTVVVIYLNVVQRITTIIKNYQDILRDVPYAPKTYFQRDSLEFSGDANKFSLNFLFTNHAVVRQAVWQTPPPTL